MFEPLRFTSLYEEWKSLALGRTNMMDRAKVLTIDVEVDPIKAKKWLPLGLKLDPSNSATIYIANFDQPTSFGSCYSEVAIIFHCRFMGFKVRHFSWMLVDDDVALLVGRELMGIPKKIGEFKIDLDSDHKEIEITRKGSKILKVTGFSKEKEFNPPPILDYLHLNLKGMFLPRLVMFRGGDIIHHANKMDVEVEVFGSERDPINTIGIGKVKNAYFYEASFGRSLLPQLPFIPVFLYTPLYRFKNFVFHHR